MLCAIKEGGSRGVCSTVNKVLYFLLHFGKNSIKTRGINLIATTEGFAIKVNTKNFTIDKA